MHTPFDMNGKSKVGWNPDLIRKGLYDRSVTWAIARLDWIAEQDPQGNEGNTEYESWAVEYPPIDQDHIFESMLTCTKKRKRTDGEPLYQEDGVTFQDHLKLFAVELLTLSAGEARHKRWEVFKHSNGRKTYRIAICTRIFVSDGGWALKRLMKRYDDIPDETGKLRYIF